MKKNKKIIIMVIGILAVIALGFGATYAWLTLTLNGTKNNVLKIGTLSLVLDDTEGEGINLQGAVPMLDEVGLALEPYTFTLTNNGTIPSDYTIYLDDVELEEGEERVSPDVLNYALTKDDDRPSVENGLYDGQILDGGKLAPGASHQYELRIWLAGELATNWNMGKVFKGKIRVEAMQSGKLTIPEESCFTLEDGMITGYDSSCSDSIIIPDTINGVPVTTIGSGAFSGQGLKNIKIPETATNIGDQAFSNNQLTSIVIPDSVTEIGPGAFAYNQLSDVTLSKNMTRIEYETFNENQLEQIIIPNGITVIDNEAFAYNRLTSLVIPDTVTTIGSGTFWNNRLTNVTFSKNLDYIGTSAFAGNRLTSLIIPSSVTMIDEWAFSGNQLISITIPSSVTSIGNSAFESNKLTSVIIKGKANSDAFDFYGDEIWGWASGYSDDSITWNG